MIPVMLKSATAARQTLQVQHQLLSCGNSSSVLQGSKRDESELVIPLERDKLIINWIYNSRGSGAINKDTPHHHHPISVWRPCNLIQLSVCTGQALFHKLRTDPFDSAVPSVPIICYNTAYFTRTWNNCLVFCVTITWFDFFSQHLSPVLNSALKTYNLRGLFCLLVFFTHCEHCA